MVIPGTVDTSTLEAISEELSAMVVPFPLAAPEAAAHEVETLEPAEAISLATPKVAVSETFSHSVVDGNNTLGESGADVDAPHWNRSSSRNADTWAERIKEQQELEHALKLVEALKESELAQRVLAIDKAVEHYEEQKTTASFDTPQEFATVVPRRRKNFRKLSPPTSTSSISPKPASRFQCLEVEIESPNTVCTSSLQHE
jgi:hypothetical protein